MPAQRRPRPPLVERLGQYGRAGGPGRCCPGWRRPASARWTGRRSPRRCRRRPRAPASARPRPALIERGESDQHVLAARRWFGTGIDPGEVVQPALEHLERLGVGAGHGSIQASTTDSESAQNPLSTRDPRKWAINFRSVELQQLRAAQPRPSIVSVLGLVRITAVVAAVAVGTAACSSSPESEPASRGGRRPAALRRRRRRPARPTSRPRTPIRTPLDDRHGHPLLVARE